MIGAFVLPLNEPQIKLVIELRSVGSALKNNGSKKFSRSGPTFSKVICMFGSMLPGPARAGSSLFVRKLLPASVRSEIEGDRSRALKRISGFVRTRRNQLVRVALLV